MRLLSSRSALHYERLSTPAIFAAQTVLLANCAKCDVGGSKSITVDYSSPRAKGRKVFGGIVPYGEVWRAGANEATTFVTTGDLMLGGHHVPAGSYTLFTIPAQDKWTLIISKKTGEWGIPYPGMDSDLARVDMKVSATPSAKVRKSTCRSRIFLLVIGPTRANVPGPRLGQTRFSRATL